MKTHTVTIIDDGIGSEFAVHLAGCNDIAHIDDDRQTTIDIEQRTDVIELIHGDIIAENDDETAEDYLDSDIYRFARCVNHIR